MKQHVLNFLGRFISVLRKLHERILQQGAPRISVPSTDKAPVIFSGGTVLCDVHAPDSLVLISPKCKFEGKITARSVIIEGDYSGLLIAHKVKVIGSCNASNSICYQLEILPSANVAGDITFDPRSLDIHKGAVVHAILTAEEDINLAAFGIFLTGVASSPLLEPVSQASAAPREEMLQEESVSGTGNEDVTLSDSEEFHSMLQQGMASQGRDGDALEDELENLLEPSQK